MMYFLGVSGVTHMWHEFVDGHVELLQTHKLYTFVARRLAISILSFHLRHYLNSAGQGLDKCKVCILEPGSFAGIKVNPTWQLHS